MSAAGLSALLRSSNTVLLGEAGCGKSELAVHWALALVSQGREVHFFDLDQTKPLMRSRDAAALLTDAGVTVHFEQQRADAPTQVGGVVPLLLDEDKAVILDVGGSDTGAKLIGSYAHLLQNADVWFVVNPYRPWSASVEHIGGRGEGIAAVCYRRYRDTIGPQGGNGFPDGGAAYSQLLRQLLPGDVTSPGGIQRGQHVRVYHGQPPFAPNCHRV